MNEPVFIDSNIWLYSFLRQDEEKRKAAKKLIKSCKRKFTFVSTQIINEVCFKRKKERGQARMAAILDKGLNYAAQDYGIRTLEVYS
jgi:predicted nucleic acid-binding protein